MRPLITADMFKRPLLPVLRETLDVVTNDDTVSISQAAGEIPQLKAYQLDINNIYQHYQYSAVRYNKLHAIQQVVDETPVALKPDRNRDWTCFRSSGTPL